MARTLDGRVAIVTGAGRGLGRAHALQLAADGAAVVVNDLGGDVHGAGRDATPAQEVVAQIAAAGGRAIVSGHDVADWQQAEQLIALAVETFGATEFWDLRMVPGLSGTDGATDIPLPSNVRRYYFPGTSHGGGSGAFSVSNGTAGGSELKAIGVCPPIVA